LNSLEKETVQLELTPCFSSCSDGDEKACDPLPTSPMTSPVVPLSRNSSFFGGRESEPQGFQRVYMLWFHGGVALIAATTLLMQISFRHLQPHMNHIEDCVGVDSVSLLGQ
jgi:hypothetical protein